MLFWRNVELYLHVSDMALLLILGYSSEQVESMGVSVYSTVYCLPYNRIYTVQYRLSAFVCIYRIYSIGISTTHYWKTLILFHRSPLPTASSHIRQGLSVMIYLYCVRATSSSNTLINLSILENFCFLQHLCLLNTVLNLNVERR